MSRLVDAISAKKNGAGKLKSEGGGGAKEYAKRVAQYVPSEILAPYIAGVGIFSTEQDPKLRLILLAAFFFVGLLLTPYYLSKMAQPGQPRKVHLIMSSIAFVVWAYSLGGFFAEIGIYYASVSSFLLIVFSMISGAIYPKVEQAS